MERKENINKIWCAIIITGQLAVLLLIVGALYTNSWVIYRNGPKIKESLNPALKIQIPYGDFQGSLYFCTKGCSYSYKSLSETMCSSNSFIKSQILPSEIEKNTTESFCSLFNILQLGMNIYLSFEVLAVISLIISIISILIYFICKKRVFCVAFGSFGFLWIFHYIGIIVYVTVTKANFRNGCSDFPTDGGLPGLCAGTGPALAFIILAVLPVVAVAFCFQLSIHREISNFNNVIDNRTVPTHLNEPDEYHKKDENIFQHRIYSTIYKNTN